MEEAANFIGKTSISFINPSFLKSITGEGGYLGKGPNSYHHKYENVHVSIWLSGRVEGSRENTLSGRNRFEVMTPTQCGAILAQGWYDHELYLLGNREVAFGNDATAFGVYSPSEPRGVVIYFDAPIFGNDQTFSDLFLKNEPILSLEKAISQSIPFITRMKTWFFSSYVDLVLDPLESSRFPETMPRSISKLADALENYVINEFVIKFRLPVVPTSRIDVLEDKERKVTVDLLGYDLVSFIVGGSRNFYVRTERMKPSPVSIGVMDWIISEANQIQIKMTPLEMYLFVLKIDTNFHHVEYYLRRE
jgi:hypothetical protein